jgi:hypothetical protein
MLIKDGESKVDSSDGSSVSSISRMCSNVKSMEIMEKVLKEKTKDIDFKQIFKKAVEKVLKGTRFNDQVNETSQELSTGPKKTELTPKGKARMSVAPGGLSVCAVYKGTSVLLYPISKGKREYVNNILFILSNTLNEHTGGKIVATNHWNLISDSQFSDEPSLERGKKMLDDNDADIVCLPVTYGDVAFAYSFMLKTEEQEEESKKSFIVYTFISSPVNKSEKLKNEESIECFYFKSSV